MNKLLLSILFLFSAVTFGLQGAAGSPVLYADANELIAAVQSGEIEWVNQCLCDGIPVDARNENGETALFVVACAPEYEKFHYDAAELLLRYGANIYTMVKDTELTTVVFQKADLRMNSIILRLKVQAPIREVTVYDLQKEVLSAQEAARVDELVFFAGCGDIKNVEWCLLTSKGRLRVDAPNKTGITALLAAVRNEHWGVATLLVRCGANPEKVVDGERPFGIAQQYLEQDAEQENFQDRQQCAQWLDTCQRMREREQQRAQENVQHRSLIERLNARAAELNQFSSDLKK